MSITVMIELIINDDQPHAMAKYLEEASVLLKRVNAHMIKRHRVPTADDWEGPTKWIVSLEFPDRESIDRVFMSAEYQDIIPTRDVAFSRYHVSIVS
jgi:uncharacterized protein (DUF1330 family)